MASNRIQYAIQYTIRELEKNNIEFVLKSEVNGHFHCRRKKDGKLFQFWAGTGKILGYTDFMGVHALIHLLKEGD